MAIPLDSVARTESSARLGQQDEAGSVRPEMVDRYLVRQSFTHLMFDSRQAMEYLFARLFAANPELRGLYPLEMTQTRSAVFQMLARLVWGIEDAAATERTLAQLARDHRKFGVREKHYRPFFDAMLDTAEHHMGQRWSAETRAAWRSVLDYFSRVMTAAARADEKAQPAWWTGEIVQHDRRADTIAVLSIRPDRPMHYQPGQYISVQAPRWLRIWRSYSIANAPRENGLIDIHVRAVPGGLVSSALVSHCGTGDVLTLGAPRGDLRVIDDPRRGLVGVAGGTGLAPIKAITEAVVGASGHGPRREVTLYVGVRHSRDLYDMRDLETLRLAYPSLRVIPVVERELDFDGRVGRLPDVVAMHPSYRDCDVYVAGPAGLVSATVTALASRVPADRLHHDPIDALEQAQRPAKVDHLSR
ncbi:MAG TPA: globin domain-containing protein [Streptosporangiaceae bacterium]|nr:globin domain-containing protein [Streptosporangiaceae bacterium]